jgi:hypothetical protein
MKKSLIALALAATALASTAAHAHTHAPAFYGSVGVTQSHLNIGNMGGFDSDATGGTVALGASFGHNFGVEASYANFGSRQMTDGVYTVDVDSSAIGLHAVAKWPVTQTVSLYVKPGVTQTRVDVMGESAHKNRASLGVGVTHAINRDLAVKAELTHLRDIAGSGLNGNALTVGLQFGF